MTQLQEKSVFLKSEKLNLTKMNRFVTKIAASLLTLLFVGGQLHAQFTTTFAKNITPGQQNGLYYSLPQTMLKLDFVIEETRLEKSLLSDYASNYMAMADYVEYETTEYRLLDVKMSTVASPDPNALFFVSVGSVRGGNKTHFGILPNGIIRSVGVDTGEEEVALTTAEMPCCQAEPVVQNDSKLMELITTGKSNAQLAKEIADKIEEIRSAKFKLISGYYEIAFNPETFKMMYEKLDAMEKEYTNLLLGNQVKKTVVKTVYVIPNKEVPTQTVAKFSENDGLTVGTAGSGEMIAVQTLPLNTMAAINAPSQSAIESVTYENKVFYRVPETANVKVTCGNKVMLEDRVTVNQLGFIMMAPLTNTKIVFDTETGQIINMKMQ